MEIKSLEQRDKRLSKVEKLLRKREDKLVKQGYVDSTPEDTETRMCESLVQRFCLYENDLIETNILSKGERMIKLIGDSIYSNLVRERKELHDYKPSRTFEEQYCSGCVKQPINPITEFKKY